MSLPARTILPESNLARVERGFPAVGVEPGQLDRNPALVYLASLSPGSRRTMATSLGGIVSIISEDADPMTFP